MPILVLTGGNIRYRGCCYVEVARALESAAKARGALFTLVTYPNAGHGFNLAWVRTIEMLRRHHP